MARMTFNVLGLSYSAVQSSHPRETSGAFFRPTGDKFLLDLWAANRDQLVRAGVREQNIRVAGICTMKRNDLLPSHRLEGDRAGRFAAIIARRGQG